MFRRALSMCPINFVFVSYKVKKQEFSGYKRVVYAKTLGATLTGVENIADHGTNGPRKYFMLAEIKKGRKKKGERKKRREGQKKIIERKR
jgi:hypothetical protein